MQRGQRISRRHEIKYGTENVTDPLGEPSGFSAVTGIPVVRIALSRSPACELTFAGSLQTSNKRLRKARNRENYRFRFQARRGDVEK